MNTRKLDLASLLAELRMPYRGLPTYVAAQTPSPLSLELSLLTVLPYTSPLLFYTSCMYPRTEQNLVVPPRREGVLVYLSLARYRTVVQISTEKFRHRGVSSVDCRRSCYSLILVPETKHTLNIVVTIVKINYTNNNTE